MEELVKQQLRDSIALKEKVIEKLISKIVDIADMIVNSLRAGGKVILFGNGGSSADAQHIAAELVNKLEKDRKALPAMALTTNTSILTSIGNDYDFESIFSRQVELWAQKGDVVVALSTSGTSANILKAVKVANEKGASTIGLTGASGDNLCQSVQTCLKVPSASTPRIQEVHITVGHIVCSLVEEQVFGESNQ